MSYLLEIVGRGLLAELVAAFRDRLADSENLSTDALRRLVAEYPDNPAHLQRLAIRDLVDGRAGEARLLFEAILEHAPLDTDAMLGLACACDECSQLPTAIDILRRAVRREPGDAAIHFAVGFCCEKHGDMEAAELSYLEALELAPQLRNAHERLAAIHLRRGEFDRAIERYEQLCWYEPGDIDLALTLANLYLRAGRPDEAVKRYQYALTIDPDNWEARGDLVSAYADAGQYEDAIAQLHQAIADSPGFADNHLRLGDLYARIGDTEAAVTQYGEAIALNPDYLEAHLKLGTIRLRKGAYLDAADAFNQALELNDRLLTAYVGLGVAQLESGQTADARETFEMAGSVEPNSSVLFSEMARLQLKASIHEQFRMYLPETPADDAPPAPRPAGDLLDTQIERLQDALQRHPCYADLHYRLGMLLRHTGQLDDAIAAFHRALEINPHYVKALIKLGLAYKEAGDLDTAIDTFRRVLAVDPAAVELHYELGLIFADRQQFAMATEQFEKAVRHDPVNVDFRANLALSLQDMGLIDRAAAAWQTLAEIAPDSARGRDILCRISKKR